MLSTPHLLVGTACGIIAKNPLLAFSFGFASHILLDLLPHQDQDHLCHEKYPKIIKVISVLDFFFGWFLVWLFLHTKPPSIILWGISGALGGILLDLIDNFLGNYLWKGFRKTKTGFQIHRFHEYCHTRTPPRQWAVALFTQGISFFVGLAMLCYL